MDAHADLAAESLTVTTFNVLHATQDRTGRALTAATGLTVAHAAPFTAPKPHTTDRSGLGILHGPALVREEAGTRPRGRRRESARDLGWGPRPRA